MYIYIYIYKFKVIQGRMSETSGKMPRCPQMLGIAYVNGLRDKKVKVIQGQISQNVGNRLGIPRDARPSLRDVSTWQEMVTVIQGQS